MPVKVLKDVMTKEVVSVFPETALFKAAKILYDNQFTGLPVIDNSVLVGIITEYDLISMESETPTHIPTLQKIFQTIPIEEGREKEIENLFLLKVKDVMNPDPLVLSKDATLEETVSAFKEHHRVNPIPVLDSQRKIVGIVSRSDLIKFFIEFPDTLKRAKTFTEQTIAKKTGLLAKKSVALFEEHYQLVNRFSEVGQEELGEHFTLFNKMIPAITKAKDMDQALEEIVKIICSSTNWILGEIWTHYGNKLFLRMKFAWSTRDHELEKFINYSRGFIFAPGEGMPGRIWLSKKSEWENDVSKVPVSTFLRAKFAEECNIKAAFGFPVWDDQDNVIAVILFFMQKASRKDEKFVKFISAVSNGLNLFLRYKLLEEKTSLLRLAFSSTSQSIMVTTPEAEIIFINKSWEFMTGYSSDEVIGKKPNELWGGHMASDFYEKLWQVIKIEKKPFSGELDNIKKNGTQYWQESHITPILDEYGEIKFYMAIAREVTEKKQREQFHDEFLSIIGHQLRNPLISISWLIEWLSKSVNLTEEDQEKIKSIYQQNKNLSNFVEDLLMISRVGKSDLSLEKTDLKSEIEAVVKEVQERNPSVVLRLDAKGRDFFMAVNKSMVVQVFANLIYNAAEYADKKDGEADIKLERTDSELLFSTHNNGPEIAEEDKPKIFLKLFRSDAAKEYKKSGTGLGLFIVKTICDSLGWGIWFESGSGKGTTFYVKIPIIK